MEVAAAATEHGWGRRRGQGARGLMHIAQSGTMEVAGTSTICIAQMMLGPSLQVTLPENEPATLQLQRHLSSVLSEIYCRLRTWVTLGFGFSEMANACSVVRWGPGCFGNCRNKREAQDRTWVRLC